MGAPAGRTVGRERVGGIAGGAGHRDDARGDTGATLPCARVADADIARAGARAARTDLRHARAVELRPDAQRPADGPARHVGREAAERRCVEAVHHADRNPSREQRLGSAEGGRVDRRRLGVALAALRVRPSPPQSARHRRTDRVRRRRRSSVHCRSIPRSRSLPAPAVTMPQLAQAPRQDSRPQLTRAVDSERSAASGGPSSGTRLSLRRCVTMMQRDAFRGLAASLADLARSGSAIAASGPHGRDADGAPAGEPRAGATGQVLPQARLGIGAQPVTSCD